MLRSLRFRARLNLSRWAARLRTSSGANASIGHFPAVHPPKKDRMRPASNLNEFITSTPRF
jgi:hypothetical protein